MFRYLLLIFCVSFPVFAQNTVVLLSIDGFSNRYLQDYLPQNILKMAKEGVRAEALLPVFPTKTFPNHISMVTGVYPAKHGIIHNKFYDPLRQKTYYVGAGKHDASWLKAEPIWTIAEKQGIKSATYFWPESEAKISGVRPSYYFPYDKAASNQTRIDQILNWLKLPSEERPYFLAAYFSTVDDAGHSFGTESTELRDAIEQLDQNIGELNRRIATEIEYGVDIILVSDHGMTAAGAKNTIAWAGLFNSEGIKVINGQTQLFLYFSDKARINDTRSQLMSGQNENSPQYQVFQKGNFPPKWHFDSELAVIPDIIVNAFPPFTFTDSQSYGGKATHGYDARHDKNLDAIFIAKGPSFQRNKVIPPFENINIFALLQELLELEPQAITDSKLGPLLPALKKGNS